MKETFKNLTFFFRRFALVASISGAVCHDGRAQGSDPNLATRGAYIAVLGDCAACHTAQGGQSYAGGQAIASPIGTIYSTNITPDQATGIGRYTFEDFKQAVRHGIRKDGKTLYPAMPYPDFSRISDNDMQALYAFFMSGVRPVNSPNKDVEIPWPLSMRWPLAWWRWIFVPKALPAPTSGDSVVERGAYLVEGPGHCGTCHTPRGLAFQQKALSPHDGPDFLAGEQIDNYTANNLRGDDLTGLGAWHEDDIVKFLKSGRNQHTAVFGGMADVVSQSTQHMSDGDLHAIAQFLKTLPATKSGAAFSYDPEVARELFVGKIERPGAMTYIDNCAACHRTSGRGYDDTFPALANNPVVNEVDPSSLIHIVLIGGTVPGTAIEPTRFAMPPFENRLSDREIADVVTLIRSSWGNKAPAVSAEDVAKFRKEIAPSPVKKTL